MRTRILCIQAPHLSISLETAADAFLALSPLIWTRAPGYFFIDISKSVPLFGGERAILEKLEGILKKLGLSAQVAIHDTPAQAQVLTQVTNPVDHIPLLPVSCLRFAEGLNAFSDEERVQVQKMVENLAELGLKTIDAFTRLPTVAILQRWGKLGYTLKRKFLGLHGEAITPYEPPPVFIEKKVFDFSCIFLSSLMFELEGCLSRMEARLLGRSHWALHMELELTHEFSKAVSRLTAKTTHASSDPALWLKLFEHSLGQVSFENPIREIKLTASALPRQQLQLQLWNDTELEHERVKELMSYMGSVLGENTVGFARLENSHIPEKAWSFSQDIIPGRSQLASAPYLRDLPPRPLRLLPSPLLWVPPKDKSQNSILFLERIQAQWWAEDSMKRDYYLAQKGSQLTWIYRDPLFSRFFVHGYFD